MVDLEGRPPRVAVVAIGTELLEGQTVNSNATWLSQELTLLGANTVWHFAVRDNFDEILRAFEWAAREADFIVTTGGLGPTQDDFTREMIAQFLGLPLVLNKEVEAKVREKLAFHRVDFLPMHERQCCFPAGAILFENPVGTAEGFALESGQHYWLSLPGPPRELAGCWSKGARAWVAERIQVPEPKKLRTWTCLGMAESDLATLVERHWPTSEFEVGYRTKPPYVEFKLWLTDEEMKTYADRIAELEIELGERLAWVGEGDITDRILSALPPLERIILFDQVSDGYWVRRWVEGIWMRLKPRPLLIALDQAELAPHPTDAPLWEPSDQTLKMKLLEDPSEPTGCLFHFEKGVQQDTFKFLHKRVFQRESRRARELYSEMALAQTYSRLIRRS